jgi:hypothetical protein
MELHELTPGLWRYLSGSTDDAQLRVLHALAQALA